jgi:hypothetical protein
MKVEVPVAKSRKSGSEKRRRTDTVNLRLLPSEALALRALAEQHGHSSVQAFIVDALKPLLLSAQVGAASAIVNPSATSAGGLCDGPRRR